MSDGEAACSLPTSPEIGASTPDLLAIQLLFEDWLCGGTGTGNPQGDTEPCLGLGRGQLSCVKRRCLIWIFKTEELPGEDIEKREQLVQTPMDQSSGVRSDWVWQY